MASQIFKSMKEQFPFWIGSSFVLVVLPKLYSLFTQLDFLVKYPGGYLGSLLLDVLIWAVITWPLLLKRRILITGIATVIPALVAPLFVLLFPPEDNLGGMAVVFFFMATGVMIVNISVIHAMRFLPLRENVWFGVLIGFILMVVPNIVRVITLLPYDVINILFILIFIVLPLTYLGIGIADAIKRKRKS